MDPLQVFLPGNPGGEKAQTDWVTGQEAASPETSNLMSRDLVQIRAPQRLGSKSRLHGAQPSEELRGMALSVLTGDPLAHSGGCPGEDGGPASSLDRGLRLV